jgi:chromosome segregation ATPase
VVRKVTLHPGEKLEVDLAPSTPHVLQLEDEVWRLREENEEMRRQATGLFEDKDRLNRELATIKSANGNVIRHRDDLIDRTTNLQADKAEMRRQRDVALSHKEEMRLQRDEAWVTIERLRDELGKARQELPALKQKQAEPAKQYNVIVLDPLGLARRVEGVTKRSWNYGTGWLIFWRDEEEIARFQYPKGWLLA